MGDDTEQGEQEVNDIQSRLGKKDESMDCDPEEMKRKIREVLAEIAQVKQEIREVLTGIAQEDLSGGRDSSLILKSLVKTLNRVTESVLADPGLATPDVVEAFSDLLQKQEDPTLRSKAIKELERIAIKYEDCAEPAIQAFKQILTRERKKNAISEDSYTGDAVEALGSCAEKYEAHAGTVVEILSETALNKDHMTAGRKAIEKLGVIGVAHESQTDTIVKALTDIACNTDKDNLRHGAHPGLAVNSLRTISLAYEVQAGAIAQTFADILEKSKDYNSSLNLGAIKGLGDIGNKFEAQNKEMVSLLKQVLEKRQALGFYYVETDVIKRTLNSLGYEPEKTPEELERERQWKEGLEKASAKVEEDRRREEEKKRKEQKEEEQREERIQKITTLAEKIFNDVTKPEAPEETSQEEESSPQDEEPAAADVEAVDNKERPQKPSLLRRIFNAIIRRKTPQKEETPPQGEKEEPVEEVVKPPLQHPLAP